MTTITENNGDSDFQDGICGSCGRSVHFVQREVISLKGYNYQGEDEYFGVLQCPSCQLGTIVNGTRELMEARDLSEIAGLRRGSRNSSMFVLAPGPLPAARVTGMPDDMTAAWDDALRCGQSGAWTPAEMMCRKILMHIAVDQFEMPEGKSFVEYVNKLDEERFFPRTMTAVIDSIRKRGNRATHDLAQSTQAEAQKTLEVTHHVLRTIYELSRM